jgi:cell division septum initiation protein DivIVA
MPDQSSAATEHAILQEITAPLDTLPDDAVAAVHADFPVALRGYDRLAVDAYVKQTSQLVAELQATRSPEAAVRKALERVGEQISGILQRAHETAEEITAQSRREGEDRLEHARIEAAEIVSSAHQRVKELDADTDRIWVERHRIVDDARELAHQLMTLADSAAERFPAVEEAPESPEAPVQEGLAPEPEPAPEPHTDAEPPAAVEPHAAPEPQAESEDAEPVTAVYDQVEDDEISEFDEDVEAGTEDRAVYGEPPGFDEPEPPQTESHPVIPPASDAATRRADQ